MFHAVGWPGEGARTHTPFFKNPSSAFVTTWTQVDTYGLWVDLCPGPPGHIIIPATPHEMVKFPMSRSSSLGFKPQVRHLLTFEILDKSFYSSLDFLICEMG